MRPVGIIANPASGKDIRRLVAHGSVFSNLEKVFQQAHEQGLFVDTQMMDLPSDL